MPRESDEDTLEQSSNGQGHDREKGESGRQNDGPVGFWSNELKDTRLQVLKKWSITSQSPKSSLFG